MKTKRRGKEQQVGLLAPGDFFLPYVNLPRGKTSVKSRNTSLASADPQHVFTLGDQRDLEVGHTRKYDEFEIQSNNERRSSNATAKHLNNSYNIEPLEKEMRGSQSGRGRSSLVDSESKAIRSIFSQGESSFAPRKLEKYRIFYNGLESTSGNTLPVVQNSKSKIGDATTQLYSTNFFRNGKRSD